MAAVPQRGQAPLSIGARWTTDRAPSEPPSHRLDLPNRTESQGRARKAAATVKRGRAGPTQPPDKACCALPRTSPLCATHGSLRRWRLVRCSRDWHRACRRPSRTDRAVRRPIPSYRHIAEWRETPPWPDLKSTKVGCGSRRAGEERGPDLGTTYWRAGLRDDGCCTNRRRDQ